MTEKIGGHEPSTFFSFTEKTVKHSTYAVDKNSSGLCVRLNGKYAGRGGATDGDINHGNNTGRPSKYLSGIHREDRRLINGRGIRKSFAFCMPGPDVACQIIVEGILFSVETMLCV